MTVAALATISNPVLAAPTEDLQWQKCADLLKYPAGYGPDREWLCSEVEVPVDYDDPTQGTIPVTVSRIPATSDDSHGALYGNPGGPGVSTIDFWVNGDTAGGTLDSFDLVTVQPRGLRYAGSKDCGVPLRTLNDPGAAYAACAAVDKAFIDSLTTENTARDMETARIAMGDDELNYYGASYGTYLGAVYATLYPENTGRVVLDSNVNPDWTWSEMAARQAESRKPRADEMWQWIADRNEYYGLGDTPLKVYRQFERMSNESPDGGFNLTPPDAQMGDLPPELRPIGQPILTVINTTKEPRARIRNGALALTGQNRGNTETGVGNIFYAAMYREDYYPVLAHRMSELREYDFDAPSDYPSVPPSSVPQRNLTTDDLVFTAVTCNEDTTAYDPIQAVLGEFNAATGGNELDVYAQRARGGTLCDGWDNRVRPVPINGYQLDEQPLLIQSIRDAATPFPGGPIMAQMMNGILVVVNGGNHGNFNSGNAAIDRIVSDYLLEGKHPTQTTVDSPESPYAPVPGDTPPTPIHHPNQNGPRKPGVASSFNAAVTEAGAPALAPQPVLERIDAAVDTAVDTAADAGAETAVSGAVETVLDAVADRLLPHTREAVVATADAH